MITVQQLRALLDYEPATGLFRWRLRKGTKSAGAIAGKRQSCGYIQITIDRRYYYAHRLAWLHAFGKWPADQIDHINRDRADNRLANLRAASPQLNAANAKVNRNSLSGHKGVRYSRRDKAWLARIYINGRAIYLGTHQSIDAAANAYADAAREHFGAFACIQ